MTREPGVAQVVLARSNVCYATWNTWGCHESYGHRALPASLPPQIIPHLVSRITFTGAGGFNSLSPGLEFLLSPRVAHLDTAVSDYSTHSRGIFHTKDETLTTTGQHRLHIICGESLCSQTALWLKVGTTALVMALIDGGVKPGEGVQLPDPVQ